MIELVGSEEDQMYARSLIENIIADNRGKSQPASTGKHAYLAGPAEPLKWQ